MAYWSVSPKLLDEFISMVKRRRLDVTDLASYRPPSKRPPEKGFIRLPIKRPPGMDDEWWEGILTDNQVPQRLVVPEDWPFS